MHHVEPTRFRVRFARRLLLGSGRGVACLAPVILACVACGGLSKKEQEVFDLHMRNAQRYYDGGNYEQAEQQVRKSLAVDEEDQKARLLLAWTLLQQDTPQTVRRALEEFEKLVKRDDGDFRIHMGLGTSRFKLGVVRRGQAETLERREDTELAARAREESEALIDRAAESYETVLELNEDYPRALSGLGQIKALRGNNDEALVLLRRYLELATATRRYFEGEKRERILTDDQLATLDNKISSNIEQEVRVRDLVANLLYDDGKPREAIDHLDRILALHPRRSQTYLQRAQCRSRLGEYGRAAEDVKLFLRKTDRGAEDPLVMRANELLAEYVAQR